MITYNPKISINAAFSGSRELGNTVSYRISCFLPSGEGFVAKGKSVKVVLPESAAIDIDLILAAEERSYRVMVGDSDDVENAKEIGTIDFEIAPAKESVMELRNVIQAQFFEAMSGTNAAMEPMVSQPHPDQLARAHAANGASSSSQGDFVAPKPKRKWKKLKIAVVLLAVLSIGWGAYTHFAVPPADDAGLALTDDFSDVSERVKQQVNAAARSGQPAVNTLAGQNVALDTMRAMGLDPGKANAGCLVGVK